MKNVVEVTHLSKSYKDFLAVNDLSFVVRKGEIFGLLGHNGAGKTTTLDCVLGLKQYDRGSTLILGQEVAKMRKELFERVGVQLQQSCYQDKIKVYELCQETAVLYKHPADYKELLEKFNLAHLSDQFVTSLSGGERQKLSVLLALLPNPEVIFLDELTTGLDTLARREVWKQLEQLKQQGVTIVLTSHFMDEVEALCDRVCILKNGKELVQGTLSEVIAKTPHDRMEVAYLWYMEQEAVV